MNHIIEEISHYRDMLMVVVITPLGHRCGYIGLRKTHPLFGKRGLDLEAHGGITWSKGEKYPLQLESGLWWLGFDAAHSCDAPDPKYTPDEARRDYHVHGTVRSLVYMRDELIHLAEQCWACKQQKEAKEIEEEWDWALSNMQPYTRSK